MMTVFNVFNADISAVYSACFVYAHFMTA